MSTHLFVYGSLLFEDVFEAVTGVRPSSEPATLHDFGRYRVAGASYPAIVPEASATTLGAIIRDVDRATMSELDRFEGDMYARQRVQVMLTTGGRADAETYVFVESARRHITGDPWNPEQFGSAARAALAGTGHEHARSEPVEPAPGQGRTGISSDPHEPTDARPMSTSRLQPSDLEDLFNDCFGSEYSTRLEGGGEEPLYIASNDLAATPHRVIYREDYFASALHEIAHWCIAGAGRRRLDDYGYWYHPDGRSDEEQQSFERAEARPQALEWIFSDLCGRAFHLSADNLEGGTGPSPRFAETVAREKQRFETEGLPPRAARLAKALRRCVSASADFRPAEEGSRVSAQVVAGRIRR